MARSGVPVEAWLRTLATHLPSGGQRALGRLLATIPRSRKEAISRFLVRAFRRRVRWGNLRSVRPFSDNYGWERGTPVDRWYIARFMSDHAADVRGACLEVETPVYTRRFGRDRVERSDVVDLDHTNPHATIHADLGLSGSLPAQRYDCIILTQTLHLIHDFEVCLRNVFDALRPGGVLLVTVSTISRHEASAGLSHDPWRFTPAGLRRVLPALMPDADIVVVGYGNLLSATAFLHGLAAEELEPGELSFDDPSFPLLAAARVSKRGTIDHADASGTG